MSIFQGWNNLYSWALQSFVICCLLMNYFLEAKVTIIPKKIKSICLKTRYEVQIVNRLFIFFSTRWKPYMRIWPFLLFFPLLVAIENLQNHFILSFEFHFLAEFASKKLAIVLCISLFFRLGSLLFWLNMLKHVLKLISLLKGEFRLVFG
jgi:hypothetical protein